MDKYKETFETWNKVASMYHDKFMDLDLYNDTYDVIWQTIAKEKAKVLDIGCGPGNITKYLLSKKPDFDVFGIDIAPKMMELASKNNPTARFAIMDSRDIDKINTKFDAAISGFCIPYLSSDDTAKLIADCYNLLNDQGLIYLSFVEGDPNTSGFQISSSGERVYFYFHLLEDVRYQLEVCNFKEIKDYKVEYKKATLEIEVHTVLVAKKG